MMNLDVADACLLAARGEVAGEVPRFIGRAVGGGEHKPGVLPGVVCSDPVPVLSLGAELERGHADIGQRQGGFRAWCLGLAVLELPASAL